jgi:hypothetical protein
VPQPVLLVSEGWILEVPWDLELGAWDFRGAACAALARLVEVLKGRL